MNRNQKIALGCGGGGCLVVILAVVAVGALIATGVIKAPGLTSYTDSDSNSNENENSNRDSNSNSSSNRNSASNENENRSSSSSTMSEDAKHRLYQAAAGTKDSAAMQRMFKKIGLGDGTGPEHGEFIKEHFPWALKNIQFIESINTPEKAREYFDEHIDD